ncbi:hypothetical protein CJD36_009620 [Flavipsychrobacter stenotrophus]|uniref:DUF3298 domain-containing protein n=1 Tax=Flavipsychrobacter stenotrophus TaxID=2077091 RepID=A0A2S7SZU1_9BACT|nr:hypothetical protein [Flavipsychrobacter stenotrophus]PQJ12036.1 hypothetical protein CJD36_009620 [Flavipsychrobacter stenotrophus]
MKTNKAIMLTIAVAGMLNTQSIFAGDRTKCGDIEYENIYKHFVGTIGKDKVVIDLRWGYCGGSNNGGSFFYNSATKDFRYLMIQEPLSYAHNVQLKASEYRIDDNYYSQSHAEVPHWNFFIQGNKLTGTWRSADGKDTLAINLTEDYSNATPLEIMAYGQEIKKGKAKYSQDVHYSFIGVKPADDMKTRDAEFISNIMLQQANGTSVNAASWADYPKAQGRKDINTYKDNYKPDWPTKNVGYHKAYCHHSMFPMYNENGILVTEYTYYNDSSNGRSFRNIDVANKKILTTADILTPDKATLTTLLRNEYNNVKTPENIEKIPADNIVPTENIIITHNGIAFNYPQTSNCSSEVWVFLSYDQLKPILTQNFRDKMKI